MPLLRWESCAGGLRRRRFRGRACARPINSAAPACSEQRNAWIGSEDCLFLNVWTGAASASERRPVFVWSYGAGFTGNSGAHPLFDGEGLARKGVIVVTMNYRAGVMGFLATPELSRESGHGASGNYGMLDQIAVLQWVQKNIAAFGGDPGRVTIAGQSAGGQSTLVLMSSPLTRGLYHRAIMESRARAMNPSLKEAESTGSRYAEAHGAHSLQELRAMPWQQLMEGDVFNRPVVDNYVVPRTSSRFSPRACGTTCRSLPATTWTRMAPSRNPA